MDKYKLKDRQYIYQGNIIDVYVDQVEYPNGNTYVRELIKHVGGVCIACLNDNNQLAFVTQYRYAFNQDLLELPAGKADHENEDLLSAAKRELEEECGVVAKTWIDMGKFIPTCAYLTETIQLYFAKELIFTTQHFDEDEDIVLQWIDLNKAKEMVMNNTITDGKTMALILKLDAYLNQYCK